MTAFQPLGDQAILAAFAEESLALGFASAVRASSPTWLFDVVQAYATVAVYFSPVEVDYEQACEQLQSLGAPSQSGPQPPGMLHRIPCCYELQLDLARVAEQIGQSTDDVIRLHLGSIYTVYAIGFCPGFPYLGYLPKKLQGVPRLTSPRLRVEPGSVGLTGKQTGIYTEARPGGWNIVGRTPLVLVDVVDGYFPLRTGDRVQFVRVDEREYGKLLGQRLTNGHITNLNGEPGA